MSENPPRHSSFQSLLLALVPLLTAGAAAAFLYSNRPEPLLPEKAPVKAPPPTLPATASAEELAKPWLLAEPARVSRDFVGSAACRDCHAAIFEKYQSTGMARAFAPVEPGNPAAVPPAGDFLHGGRTYRVETRDGRQLHCEALKDDGPEPIYEQQVPIDFAMGSGNKGRSYLFHRNGLLFMSPISYYSEQDRFDLSPGYHPEKGDRFERRISSRCLSCHVGQANPVENQLDRYGDPPILEHGIGCERCHGPGAAHIAFRQGDPGAPASDPVIRLSRLTHELREAVCNQCHLLGADEVLRFGRSDFDFRPGMHLSEVWTLFLEPSTVTDDGSPRAVSQVEQMRSSRCYRLSGDSPDPGGIADRKLDCTSCHDPHFTPAPEDRAAWYRNRCLSCHEQQGCTLPAEMRHAPPALDSCIHCHMPKSHDNDIPHVSQTDHSIVRLADAAVRRRPNSGRRSSEIFTDGLTVPPQDLQRARGLAAARQAESKNDKDLAAQAISQLEPIAAANPRDLPSAAAIAKCYLIVGRPQDAVPLWQVMLEVDTQNEEALLSLAQYSHRTGMAKASLKFVDLFLERNEWPAHAQGLRAQLREQLGDSDGALESARIALERDPTQVTAYLWLEQACSRAGLVDEAKRYQGIRERLQRRTAELKKEGN